MQLDLNNVLKFKLREDDNRNEYILYEGPVYIRKSKIALLRKIYPQETKSVPSNYGWAKYHYLMKDNSTSTTDLNQALLSTITLLPQAPEYENIFFIKFPKNTDKRLTADTIESEKYWINNVSEATEESFSLPNEISIKANYEVAKPKEPIVSPTVHPEFTQRRISFKENRAESSIKYNNLQNNHDNINNNVAEAGNSSNSTENAEIKTDSFYEILKKLYVDSPDRSKESQEQIEENIRKQLEEYRQLPSRLNSGINLSSMDVSQQKLIDEQDPPKQ